MKQLLILLFILVNLSALGQTYTAERIVATRGFYLKDRWVDSIGVDTAMSGEIRSLPSSDAVYRLVHGRLANLSIPYSAITGKPDLVLQATLDDSTSVLRDSINALRADIASGGGGATLPSQTGNGGKYLTTDGTTASWGTVSGAAAPTTQSLTDGATITWNFDSGANTFATVTAAGNRTVSISNIPADGKSYSGILKIKQDATGNRAITLPGHVDSALYINPSAHAETIIGFTTFGDGSPYWTNGPRYLNIVPNTTPDAPTVSADDAADTLSFSHALGTSEIEVSENDGAYAPYAGTINVGDVARDAGYWKARIKAATGRNESAITESPAFTVATAGHLYEQNFDAVTPPALPSGWSGTMMQSYSFASAASGLQVLSNQTETTLGYAYYGTVLPVTRLSAKIRIGGASQEEFAMMVRSNSTTYESSTAYVLDLIFNNPTPSGSGLLMLKRTSGSNATPFGTTRVGQSTAFAEGQWYEIIIEISGTTTVTMNVKAQRVGDGQWLNASGSWQAGETAAITLTDSSSPISADGYSGVLFYGTSANYIDDFTIN